MLSSILGTFGWCYVGGYRVLKGPVSRIAVAYLEGTLTAGKLAAAVIQGFVLLSLAGGVWCIGYMLNMYFKDHDR